jgi:hypothetical protein
MKKQAEVIKTVEVEIDESVFTDEFMKEFRENFYPFDTIDEHIEYLSLIAVHGGFDYMRPFIEGYGYTDEMGIKATIVDTHTSVVADITDET